MCDSRRLLALSFRPGSDVPKMHAPLKQMAAKLKIAWEFVTLHKEGKQGRRRRWRRGVSAHRRNLYLPRFNIWRGSELVLHMHPSLFSYCVDAEVPNDLSIVTAGRYSVRFFTDRLNCSSLFLSPVLSQVPFCLSRLSRRKRLPKFKSSRDQSTAAKAQLVRLSKNRKRLVLGSLLHNRF